MLFMDFATDAAVELRQDLCTTPTERNRRKKRIGKSEYDLTYTMLAVQESRRDLC